MTMELTIVVERKASKSPFIELQQTLRPSSQATYLEARIEGRDGDEQ